MLLSAYEKRKDLYQTRGVSRVSLRIRTNKKKETKTTPQLYQQVGKALVTLLFDFILPLLFLHSPRLTIPARDLVLDCGLVDNFLPLAVLAQPPPSECILFSLSSFSGDS